jgi:hypothetical protein
MNILKQKFDQEFHDIAEFKRRTRCPLANETLRRAIYLGKPLTIPLLIIITKYLGFSPGEIKKILKDAGDKDFYPLIGDSAPLSEGERGLLAAVSAIKGKEPQQLNSIADHINLIGRAIGLDIREETDKLRIPKPTFRGGHEKRIKKKVKETV